MPSSIRPRSHSFRPEKCGDVEGVCFEEVDAVEQILHVGGDEVGGVIEKRLHVMSFRQPERRNHVPEGVSKTANHNLTTHEKGVNKS